MAEDYHIGIYLLYLAVQIATAVHILFTKRDQPGEALYWLMIIMLIPGIGLLSYLTFGIVRLERAQKKVRELKNKLAIEAESQELSEVAKFESALSQFAPSDEVAGRAHNRLMDRLFDGASALDGNFLEKLQNGTAAYARMLDDIRNAKHCIRMQSYILMNDEVGKKFMDALRERADAGVDVKVIFDSLGSFKLYFSHYFRKLMFSRHPNFSLRPFSQFNLIAPWRFQLRNHRKLLIVDGRIAYSGGINISSENERLKSVPKTKYIHDLHCRIEGPCVARFSASFFLDWAYTTKGRWADAITPYDFPLPERHGNTVVRVLSSGPGGNYEGTKDLFFAAALSAKKSLWIMTPYFVPGAEFINILCLTAARGVDVRIIVPAETDHFFMDLASHNFYRLLLERGVNIYAKKGFFSHIKALLVDNEWGFMGSSNCDNRSFRLNFELDFCFENSDFVDSIRAQFAQELSHSQKFTLEEECAKSYPRQLLENICALFTPIL